MKNILNKSLTVGVVLTIVYLIASVFHLSWFISKPDGFWSLMFFWEVFRNLIVTALVVIPFLFLLFILIGSFFSFITGKGGFKDFLKSLGMFAGFIVILSLVTVVYNGIPMYFTKKLSDKYTYINKSEKYIRKGELKEAIQYSEKALNKAKNHKIPEFFIFTKLYANTAFAKRIQLRDEYAATVNYAFVLDFVSLEGREKAFDLYRNALNISNHKLLKNQEDLKLLPFQGLAEIELSKGNFGNAEKYFDSLSYITKNLSIKDESYHVFLQFQFVDKALRTGDIKKMSQILDNLLSDYDTLDLNKKSSFYFNVLVMSSYVSMYLNDLEKAGAYLLEAKKLSGKRKDKVEYQNFLIAKANYCLNAALYETGNTDLIDKSFFGSIKSLFTNEKSNRELFINEGENTFRELLKRINDLSGKENTLYVSALNQAGLFNSKIGRAKEAEKYFEELIELIGGTNQFNPNFKQYYLHYLLIKDSLDESDLNLIKNIETHVSNAIDENILLLTEEERVNFILKTEKNFKEINALYFKLNDKHTKVELYSSILTSKSIALDINRQIRNEINSLSNDLKNEYYDIIKLKEGYSANNVSPANLENEKHINQRESKFIQTHIKDKNIFSTSIRTSWDEVKQSLNNDQVAIEFYKDDISEFYYALIITSEIYEPIFLKLFHESDLIEAIDVKGTTKERITKLYLSEDNGLYNLIWAPVRDFLNDKSKIIISPDGLLHNVSFTALLQETNLEIKMVSSVRNYLNHNITETPTQSITLFGGVDYGSNKNENKNNERLFLNTSFTSLQYTEPEVKAIDSLFKLNNLDSNILLGKEASEQNLYQFENSPTDILHIATHGIYVDNELSYILDDSKESLFQNPLNKSLLILANANELNQESLNDGIVTATDITKLNLSHVDLVVLSACETGLGDLMGSEGIFGLTRGFKNAGVNSLIVSLWEVPDKETQELMINFYNYLIEGYSKSESLYKAQTKMKSKYSNPYYWAGFVLFE